MRLLAKQAVISLAIIDILPSHSWEGFSSLSKFINLNPLGSAPYLICLIINNMHNNILKV